MVRMERSKRNLGLVWMERLDGWKRMVRLVGLVRSIRDLRSERN
jgi:hypothetical protein